LALADTAIAAIGRAEFTHSMKFQGVADNCSLRQNSP
jgi:hypothetical protein